MFVRYTTWRRTHRVADLRAFVTHRGMLPTWWVLALSLAGACLAAWMAERAAVAARAQEFETIRGRIESEIDRVMASYQRTLLAGAGLFAANPATTREGWRAFVQNISIDRNFPGIQGFGYARVATPLDGQPTDADQVRTSIVYLEPRDWRNERAIGYDMFAEPVRHAAMVAARDSGAPRLTRRVTLVQETGYGQQPGVLMYAPVYSRAPQSVEDRRELLLGYVYAAFRMHDLLTRTVGSQLPGLLEQVQLRIFDGAAAEGPALLYEGGGARGGSAASTRAPGLTAARDLPVGGQVWRIETGALPSFAGRVRGTSPWLVLSLGACLSLLITGIAAALALSHAAAVEAQRVLAVEVAARTEAERQVQLTNQELIHRVKNMMGVVSSIATQTARFTPEPERFTAAFRDRLAALGRVHDHLRPGVDQRAGLKALVREVLAPYADLRADRLAVSGPEVEVGSQTAVMLSLVINELATNAIKYGAWSNAEGRIELTWDVVQREAERDLCMSWTEKAGPPVAAPARQGFGSNVLKFALERALRGTFIPVYDPAGFRCTWRVPLGT